MIQLARADDAGKRTESALSNYSKLAAEGFYRELRAEALVKSARMLKDGGKTTDAVASFNRVLQLKDEKAAAWPAIARYGLIWRVITRRANGRRSSSRGSPPKPCNFLRNNGPGFG